MTRGPDSATHRMDAAPGPRTSIDGREVLYFAGTGYLGLQSHPAVIEAGCDAMRKFGVHSGTVRTGYGTTGPVLDVERGAARLMATEDAVYLASGYIAPAAMLAGIGDAFDSAFVDEHAHHAITDALRIAGRPIVEFDHRDADALAARMQLHLEPGQRPLVVSDGVFAVTGAIAPVRDYLDVIARFGEGALALDDAHAIGVLGERGRGTFEHAGVTAHRLNTDSGIDGVHLYACATLSKAIGGHGGIIAGSAAFCAAVRDRSHAYRAASAPAAAVAAATARALQIVADEPALRSKLAANVARLKAGLRSLGLDVADTPVPIIGLSIGDAANMQRIHRALLDAGIAIAYIPRYAGVGEAGLLRIAVFSTHTEAMIDQLLRELAAHL